MRVSCDVLLTIEKYRKQVIILAPQEVFPPFPPQSSIMHPVFDDRPGQYHTTVKEEKSERTGSSSLSFFEHSFLTLSKKYLASSGLTPGVIP